MITSSNVWNTSDENTYRLATEYPATDMELKNVIIAYQAQLENFNTRI